MKNVRLWIALLALMSFLAGLNAGLSIDAKPRRVVAPSSGPFDEYQADFTRRFQLDQARQRLFAELLRNYAKEIEDARTALLRRNQPELDQTLSEIGHRYRGYIRDHVLPPSQRAEFDALAESWQTIQ